MKINNISLFNNLSLVNAKRYNKNVSFLANNSDTNRDEITVQNKDGTKTVLRNIKYLDDSHYSVQYFKITDENNNTIRDIRFDKRYNDIRAIEYQKPYGGFNEIQGAVTVSFDNNQNIRNVYLINKTKDCIIHSVLHEKYGLSITKLDKNNNKIPLNNKEFKEQAEYFKDFTYNMLSLAQKNNLEHSIGVLDKFSSFFKGVI